MTYKLTYPDGRTETILSIQNYDYNWQFGYQFKPIRLPKGTKLTVIAHYDNSPNNRANPDSNRTVYWGDQAWGRNDVAVLRGDRRQKHRRKENPYHTQRGAARRLRS